MTLEANESLQARDTQNQLQVNKAVSFHALKSNVFRLLFEQPSGFKESIRKLLVVNPTAIRENRVHRKRHTTDSGSNRRSLNFQRYARKQVF
jgi:hypothetical protein